MPKNCMTYIGLQKNALEIQRTLKLNFTFIICISFQTILDFKPDQISLQIST